MLVKFSKKAKLVDRNQFFSLYDVGCTSASSSTSESEIDESEMRVDPSASANMNTFD